MIRKLAFAVVMACLCALLLVGCGEPGATDASAAHPATNSPEAHTTHPEQEAINPDPNSDWGFTVQITNSGFHPKQLLSPCCQNVTFKNLTAHDAVVIFYVKRIKSDPIPPGGTWVLKIVGAEAIGYGLQVAPGVPPMNGLVLVQAVTD